MNTPESIAKHLAKTASSLYTYAKQSNGPLKYLYYSTSVRGFARDFGVGKSLALSTYEKEMLALVSAVQKWRHYLLGRQFVVRTDHSSLKHLWEQRIHTVAKQKWLTKLLGYDFRIEYKAGKENRVADALSRKLEQDTHEGPYAH